VQARFVRRCKLMLAAATLADHSVATDALVAALDAGDFPAVERCARERLAQKSNHPPLWQALGVALSRQNRAGEAIDAFDRAISLGGDGVALRFELATALESAHRLEDAVAHLKRAAAIDPTSFEVHANLAALLEKIDRQQESLAVGRRAIELNPKSATANFNLGTTLQSLGELDAAINAFDKAIELDPKIALAYSSRGCCKLLQENFTDGWRDYAWRSKTGKVELMPFPFPEWDGKPLPDGTLLLHGEQGVGDEIMFASCLPELVQRVGKCVLVCEPRLAALMAQSFPAVMVVAHKRLPGAAAPTVPCPVTAQIAIGDLPLHLRSSVESFPARKRFLLADPTARRQWRERYASLGMGLKIGISWHGGGTWEERRRRTTKLNQWRELLSIPNVQFINLQHGEHVTEIDELKKSGIALHDFADANPLGDLDAFAAKVASLDLVISIGNANVHLAGAIGLPTWCLLPFVPQFRWGMERTQSLWYPSVQLIRQPKLGDWDSAIAEAARRLREFAANQKTSPIAATSKKPTPRPVSRPKLVEVAKPVEMPKTVAAETPPVPAAALVATKPIKPQEVKRLVEQAVAHFNANEIEKAGAIAEQILTADQHNLYALRILAAASRKANQYDRAHELMDRAVALNPADGVLHFERGLAFMEQSRQREAYDCFIKSTQVNPKFQPAFVNVSAILEQQERFAEAMEWAKKAMELKPDCHLAHYNLANTLREYGRVAEAIKHYERTVKLNPEYVKARWNLGICHVLLGQFAKAWPLFELRETAEEVKIDRYMQPRWDGSSLAGKTIVVHAEQGIGDEVLFASCFQDIIDRAGKTILVCEPRLVKLFKRSFPKAFVHGWARRKDWSAMPIAEHVDFQLPAGSLPLYLRNTAADFPQRESFLIADPELVAQWRRRFASLGEGLKIGISWRAGGKANEGRKRTIPLTDWQNILTTPNVHFVNLQYSDSSEDLAEVKEKFGVQVHDWEQGDPLVDMDNYAAKVAALDLVISVGNAAVHLAGSLGTPAWTMLPRVPSWRWMVTGEVSPWYSSVRLFRQPARCEWEPVLQQIADRLGEIAQAGRQGRSIEHLREQVRAVMSQNEPPDAAPIAKEKRSVDDWIDANGLGNRQPLQVIQSLYDQAEAAMRERDWAGAEQLYCEILQITPRHLYTHAGLGRVAMETGRTDLAIRSFRRSLNLFEAHAGHHAQLAAALLDAERAEEALGHAQRAVALDPKLAQGRLQLGRAFQAIKQHAEALSAFNALLQATPNDPEALAGACRNMAVLGRLDEALHELKSHPDLAREPVLQLAIGEILLEDQCFADAERSFQVSIRLNPKLAAAHFHLAQLYDQQSKVDTAIQACRKALDCRPQWASAQIYLVALFCTAGKLPDAEQACQRALELQPESAELLIALGNLQANQNNHAAAVATFDRTLTLHPDNLPAQQGRGASLEKLQTACSQYLRLDGTTKIAPPHTLLKARKNSSKPAR
jgi:tetratricopeptide (TPR) repeat protein